MIISYLLIIILVITSGIYVMFRLHHLDSAIQSMNTIDAQAIRLSKEIAQAIYSQMGFEKKYIISGDPDFQKQFDEMNEYLDEKMEELKQVAMSSELQPLWASLKELHKRYRASFGNITTTTDQLRKEEFQQRDQAVAEMEDVTTRIAERAEWARNAKLQSSEKTSAQIVKAITITEMAAIVLVVLISFLLTRTINVPIRLLREKTKMIAKGEFGKPLKISSPPEIGELAESFNAMCARLNELDQMKLDFISHLSHELRTPLTAIKEASSMLKEGIFANHPGKQQDLFDIINAECERLIASVSRILDLSRMEAGMAQFSFEFAPMAPIIEKIVAKLSPIARRKNIELSLELCPGIPAVQADEEKIGQVIENIIDNALKFTSKGGKITVRLSEKREKQSVEVAVSDTGCGIPKENLQEIFDKFKRVDDRKGAVRGTGLGLAIARHIINAHGGAIWAESEPGKGSTFIFSLPFLLPVSL